MEVDVYLLYEEAAFIRRSGRVALAALGWNISAISARCILTDGGRRAKT